MGAGSGEILTNAVRAFTSPAKALATPWPSFESPSNTARKIAIIHQRMGEKSFWINGLSSNVKSFDSSPVRPYTPPVQSVVPIYGSPFGELR